MIPSTIVKKVFHGKHQEESEAYLPFMLSVTIPMTCGKPGVDIYILSLQFLS